MFILLTLIGFPPFQCSPKKRYNFKKIKATTVERYIKGAYRNKYNFKKIKATTIELYLKGA
jgi:hypothetical protein